jgi:hypothetical protein
MAPELSFKTEGVGTSAFSSFTQTNRRITVKKRNSGGRKSNYTKGAAWGERERLVTASPVMAKSRLPARGINYAENGLVKPPKHDTRVLSPAGMSGGKAPLRLAAQ